jgi:hypothetical protein
VFSLHIEETLRSLKPVSSAQFNSRDSPDGCLENTRENVLCKMISWLAEPTSPALSQSQAISVFWLAGFSGTGKSTIIKTFCQRVDSDDRYLLASFFASQKSAERRDPYSILHTFAYQLAITNDQIRPHVLSAVRAPGDILKQPMYEQVKELLAKPIAEAKLSGITIVLAIDALDECQKTAGVGGGPLIRLLAQALRHSPVKLIVSSRQEESIAKMFRSLHHVPLRLDKLASAIIKADVRRIFTESFEDIRREHARHSEMEHWPNLNTLVDRTGPLLIYAATVLRFVRFSPAEPLNQVLKRVLSSPYQNHMPFSQVDGLYMNMLQAVVADKTGRVDENLCRRVGKLLRVVVLLEEPVSIESLSHLMGEPASVQQADSDVRALASVMLISSSSRSERFSETVSTFHPSFRDFLVDSQRCTDERFLVVPVKHHHELLDFSLQLLNRNLHYDICGIGNPGQENAQIKNLPAQLRQYVPEAMRYACQFWPVHLAAGGSLSESVCKALLVFCTRHLFHWIEVLSLLGELSSAWKHLPRVIVWCQVSISTRQRMVSDSYYSVI